MNQDEIRHRIKENELWAREYQRVLDNDRKKSGLGDAIFNNIIRSFQLRIEDLKKELRDEAEPKSH